MASLYPPDETAFSRALRAHVADDDDEARSLERILAHVARGGDLFDRARSDGHITGSAFVVDAKGERLLLLLHRKLGRWLQPGGHGEPGERDALLVALREAEEETHLMGLAPHPNAPAPFDVDVHGISARANEPAHDHLDVRYLLVAPEGATPRVQASEAEGLAWVSIEELAARETGSIARAARKLLRLRG